MTRPGDHIRAVAARLFAAETMERVIEPILADLRCEYDEALARGLLWRARVNLVRSYFAFGTALFCLGVWTACTPRSEVVRTCVVSAVASAFMTVALVIPPLLSWPTWRGNPGFTALLSVTLIPQTLPLTIPAGLCVAVLWATRGKIVTWRRVGTVLAIALASTIVVWVVLECLMPHANQGFREMVAARLSGGRVLALEPGLNELGLSRLGARSDPAAVRRYQEMWAICLSPLPLSLLAFGLAGYVRRAISAVVLAMALSTAYYAFLNIAGPTTSASVPPWTPNVVFGLAGTALLVRAHRWRAT